MTDTDRTPADPGSLAAAVEVLLARVASGMLDRGLDPEIAKELASLAVAVEVLGGLSGDCLRRALAYLNDRFGG